MKRPDKQRSGKTPVSYTHLSRSEAAGLPGAGRRGASVRNSDGAQNSLDFDHLGVAFAHGKLVAAHGQLHRVAQRSDLPDVDLGALGQPHVHDAALDRALAVQPLDLRGLSDPCLLYTSRCV